MEAKFAADCNLGTLVKWLRILGEGLVPAYVYQKYPRFRRCPYCSGIFWPRTHRRNIEEALRKRSLDHRP